MEKIIKHYIFFLIIFSCNLLSFENSFEAKENGLIINITNLEYKIIKKTVSKDSSYIHILNSDYAFPSSNSIYFLDEFNFPIALPDFDVSISYSILASDTLENILLFERKDNQISENESKISIINKGIKRGIHVATLLFRPFDYNNSEKRLIITKSIRIQIHFKNLIPIISPLNSREIYHFNTYINQEHIPSLIKLASKQKYTSEELLKKSDWYSPDKKYLRVTTKQDGIGIIEASKIILSDNSFKNVNLDYLHLLWEGEEYPIYIKDNGNAILDEDDLVIFVSKRASGDTTWFDFYTSEANFFLFIDSSSQGIRFKSFPQVINPSNQISSVNIKKHIEEEHIYMYGYFPELYENIDGEMWAWKIISPWDAQYFYDSLYLIPSPNPEDTLNISVRFKSNRFNTKQNPNHKLSFIFNSDTLLTKEYPGKAGDFLSYTFRSNDILSGLNMLNILSLGYYLNNELVIPDEVGIDYVTINGKTSPFASNGKADFYIDKLSQSSLLKVSGFKSNNIILIDTENQFLQINNKNIEGTSVAVASKKGSLPILSVSINDTSIVKASNSAAIVGVCYSSDYNTIEFKQFDELDATFTNYLNSIPIASIVAVAFNPMNELTTEVKNTLIQLGSKQIKDYQVGNSFVIILRKNSSNQIYEILSSNNTASLYHFIEHPNGKSYQTEINLKEDISYHIISSDITNAEISTIEIPEPSNLANKQNQADVLVVYHKQFKQAAEKYVELRKQTHKSYNFLLIDVDNIYKEFNYGRKSPHAIKNFLKYTANQWQQPAPSFIILFGDACWDTRKVMPTTQNTDFIPSYGVPVSDFWYCLLDEKDYIADIELGRIPSKTIEQAISYVEKLKEYAFSPLEPWKKNILYLTGGYNLSENNQFYNAAELYGSTLINSRICVDTFMIRKRNYSAVSSFEKDEIIARINHGMAWVTYLGHGSPQFFDMDGWQVEYLDNKNKYSIFNSLSCNTGAFAEPQGTCRNEDYLLAPERGFISTAASTGVSFVDIDIEFHLRVSRQLAKVQNQMPTVIELYNNAKSQMLRNEPEILTAMTYSLLGDPLIALQISVQPDFYFLPQDITIKNSKGETIITEDDSTINIIGTIYNGGYSKPGTIKVLLIREYQNKKDSLYKEYLNICPDAYFNFNLPVLKMPGIHKITIIVDPDSINNDVNYSNNKIEKYIEVFVKSLIPLEPLAYWDKETKNPLFRVINPETIPSKYGYEFEIKDSKDINNVLKHSTNNEIQVKEAYIEWKPEIELTNGKSYYFIARALNPEDSTKTPMLIIPFTASSNYALEKTIWEMHGKEHLSHFVGNGLELIENSDNSYLRIKNNYYNYRIISANGNQTVDRFGEIKYRDTTYVVSENVGDVPVGFNFVVISGNGGYYKYKRNFYTWGKYEWWEDSTGIHMIKFLRDSIDTNDYVLIATCDQSFRLFVYHKELKTSGSLDTLVAVLKEYGSQFADSLRWGCSFAMVGRRGAKPGTYPELYDTSGAKIVIEDSLKIINHYAALTTPWFGPAKKWRNINILGDFSSQGIQYKTTLYGKDKFNSNEKLIFEADSIFNASIDSLPTSDYTYIKYQLQLFRINDTIEPHIERLRTEFSPAEEFAMLKSLTFTKKDIILRGETADFQFGVQNISARATSEPSTLRIKAFSKSGDIFTQDFNIEELPPSSIAIRNFSSITDNFAQNTVLSSQINFNNHNNELYFFNNNNSFIFHIYEDTIKPEILLMLDGKKVQNGDYSSLVPKVEIHLLDNSPRPIDSTKISVRINGYIQPQPKVIDYNFTNYGRDIPLKAKVTFTSDTLDYRDNVFIIRGVDASGNETESMIYVFVSPKGTIEKINNFPNPFSDKTLFKLKFVSPFQEGLATIQIFNEIGQKVRTIEKQLFIGDNDFEWDAKDDYGNTLPNGVYIYVVFVHNNVFVEPVRGNCLYIK